MPDQGTQKPLGPLEPAEGMVFYNTAPLAGKKRQRDEDDIGCDGKKRKRDEDDIGGDEYGTTNPTDATVNNTETQHITHEDNLGSLSNNATVNTTQTQHINHEDKLGSLSDIANSAATHQDTHQDIPAAEEKEAARINVTITQNEVRNGDNGLEVKDNDTWCPAIYHHEFVRNIFGKDALYGPTGSQQYTHGRADGKLDGDEYDRTSYVPAQKHWGKDRAHRPSILFEFKKPDNVYPATTPPKITWPVGGVRRTVIDVINNKPLRNFAHIPITVSTKIEGWLLEAWFRYDPSLRFEDLIQRMPFKPKHNVYKSRAVINRLVRRRELFRDVGRCLSWTKTTWTKKWDLYLISQMSMFPDNANPNSTRHLNDLPKQKKQTLHKMISESGEFLAKGQHRALKGERRDEKDQDIERTLASDVAKEIKAALDQVSNSSATVLQAPKKSRRSGSKRKQAIRNTTIVQPQQNVHPDPVVVSAGSTSYSNIDCASQPRMTGNLDVDEEDVNLADPGYSMPAGDPLAMEYPGMTGNLDADERYIHLAHGDPGYSMPAGDPLAMKYLAESEMAGNTANAQPQFDAPNQQRQTQNIQGMQPPHQQFMSPADRQGIDDVFGGMGRTQGGYEYNGYGDELGDFFGELPSLLTAAATTTTTGSSEESQRSLSQPPNPAHGGGPIGDEIRSLFHRAQPYGLIGRDRGLMQSQYYQFEQPSRQMYDGRNLRSQSYPQGLYPGHDTNGAEFMCEPSAYDDRGLLQRSSMLEAQSSFMPQQQVGLTYVDENRHAWREISPNGRALGNNPHYDGVRPGPAAPESSIQQMMATNEIGQQTTHPFQRNNVTAGLGRTSSRKRGAPAELDDDLVGSSRKSRKTQ